MNKDEDAPVAVRFFERRNERTAGALDAARRRKFDGLRLLGARDIFSRIENRRRSQGGRKMATLNSACADEFFRSRIGEFDDAVCGHDEKRLRQSLRDAAREPEA